MIDKQIPAFPTNTGLGQHQAEGMTLRDYFAVKAMQSILSRTDGKFTTTLEYVGGKSYQYADAMLAARNK